MKDLALADDDPEAMPRAPAEPVAFVDTLEELPRPEVRRPLWNVAVVVFVAVVSMALLPALPAALVSTFCLGVGVTMLLPPRPVTPVFVVRRRGVSAAVVSNAEIDEARLELLQEEIERLAAAERAHAARVDALAVEVAYLRQRGAP